MIKSLFIASAILTSSLFASADMYQCGTHHVVTGENGVSLDGQKMTFDHQDQVYKLGEAYFDFNEQYVGSVLESKPTLVYNGQTLDCK